MCTYIYTCMGCPSDPNQISESPVSETRIAFKSWPAKPQPPMTSMCHIKCPADDGGIYAEPKPQPHMCSMCCIRSAVHGNVTRIHIYIYR